MVTDHIAQFDEKGVQLQSGDRIDCDVVVTATGVGADGILTSCAD